MLIAKLRTLCVNFSFQSSIIRLVVISKLELRLHWNRLPLLWRFAKLFLLGRNGERRKGRKDRRVRECSFPPLSTRRCNPEIRLNVGYPARGTSPFLRSLWTAGSSSHYLARQTPRAHPPRHTPIHTLKGTPRHTAPTCIDVCLRSWIQLKAWDATAEWNNDAYSIRQPEKKLRPLRHREFECLVNVKTAVKDLFDFADLNFMN